LGIIEENLDEIHFSGDENKPFLIQKMFRRKNNQQIFSVFFFSAVVEKN
jgi:hypothetical protein